MAQLAQIQTEKIDIFEVIQNAPLSEEKKKYWSEKIQKSSDSEKNSIIKIFLDEKSMREDADRLKEEKYRTAKERLLQNLQIYEEKDIRKEREQEQKNNDVQKANDILQTLNKKI